MQKLSVLLLSSLFSISSFAAVCTEFGPQTPRDITSKKGTNKVKFNKAPKHAKMNLCNIHFHKNAEHKGPAFSKSAGSGEFGGFMCNKTPKKSELTATKKVSCTNVAAGETVEVHWVFTSCDVKPGKGLGACLSKSCANPQLRVETEVFLLTSGSGADFTKLSYAGKKKGYHQPGKLAKPSGIVEFLGSTTGPSFTEEVCSPLQVTWSVRPTCRKLNIDTLHKFCKKNVFEEDHAHGVRQLVTNPKLLSPIK